MIISASRRTDIPAFYAEWFFNRINDGFALVRNPMNNSQIRKVPLAPELVDCIVFWTKNPQEILSRLDMLNKYHYYFQFTLTPYERDIETGLPDKTEIMDTFRKLSDKLGVHRVIWRYDPILLNEKHTVAYHTEHFGKMAHTLKSYTEKVTISFIDFYSKTERAMSQLKIEKINEEIKHALAKQLAAIARENSLIIDTCAEDIELSRYGITRARCIDGALVERITGYSIDTRKDKSQRPECGCAASIDIGAYNTCRHGCLYCYANCNRSVVLKNMEAHNKLSPLLVGECLETDRC
jgi:DNA repair photolyase